MGKERARRRKANVHSFSLSLYLSLFLSLSFFSSVLFFGLHRQVQCGSLHRRMRPSPSHLTEVFLTIYQSQAAFLTNHKHMAQVLKLCRM
mmetsp:Transcript_9518/g.13302  ORF Transcript_9518/g.13302 Transcript_9518/m.13302 type:complete len:90 (-) Transcript_9518:64-333(-)